MEYSLGLNKRKSQEEFIKCNHFNILLCNLRMMVTTPQNAFSRYMCFAALTH